MRLGGLIVIGALAGSSVMSAHQQTTEQQQKPVPLGDIAREAEAAKATVKKAKKSYTNADLSADPNRGATVSDAPAAEQAPPGGQAPRGERYWRQQADSISLQVDKAQGRLATLTTPRATGSGAAQQAIDSEIARARSALNDLLVKWDALENEARAAKINLEWLGPRPNFNQ